MHGGQKPVFNQELRPNNISKVRFKQLFYIVENGDSLLYMVKKKGEGEIVFRNARVTLIQAMMN